MAPNKEIKVNSNSVLGTTYSQLVSVTVTDTDVVLEFIYINPRTPEEGNVVSRVTLPKPIALDLANTIHLLTKTHDNKTTKND